MHIYIYDMYDIYIYMYIIPHNMFSFTVGVFLRIAVWTSVGLRNFLYRQPLHSAGCGWNWSAIVIRQASVRTWFQPWKSKKEYSEMAMAISELTGY